MHFILQGFYQALRLLFSGDSATYEIAFRSLEVSASALAISLVIGVPLGAQIALNRFPARRLVVALVNTGMGIPPVVIGLVVALFLWRSGPLGGLDWIYTVRAMIVAQVLIALPIVTGLTLAALQQLDAGFRLQIQALGAGRWRTFLLLLREIRIPLMGAVMAAFGGVISEVGAVLIVGGNITHQTQVLTTGIVQYVDSGVFGTAMALSVILVFLAFATNYAMTIIQQHGAGRGEGTRMLWGRRWNVGA
jgi:tungstate transport system permease protein